MRSFLVYSVKSTLFSIAPEGGFPCTECGKVMKRKGALVSHLKSHTTGMFQHVQRLLTYLICIRSHNEVPKTKQSVSFLPQRAEKFEAALTAETLP